MIDKDTLRKHPAIPRVYNSRVNLKKDSASRMVARCPFPGHEDKNASFNIYLDGFWKWKCFVCGGGDVFEFIQRLDGVDFKEAVKRVSEAVGESWEGRQERVERVFKPVFDAKKTYKTFSLKDYEKYEKALVESENAVHFLDKRGIKLDTAKKLHLGFRQDCSAFCGETNNDIAYAGWIAMPCIRGEEVVSVKFRSIDRKAFCKLPGGETTLFNTNTIEVVEPVYVLEGELDAVIMEQAGFKSVSLPNASTKLTPEMKAALLKADKVILAGDSDEAGSRAMESMFKEMPERTFLLKWPNGWKDANEAYLAIGDETKFKAMVEELTDKAVSSPMPEFKTLQEAITAGKTGIIDSPERFRFPWAEVDDMAILMPGSVLTVTASATGMGKTCFVMNATLEAARKHGETVVNYQCELTPEEFGYAAAAHILHKDRNLLTEDDRKEASKRIRGINYHVGRDPALNTVTPTLDLIEAAIVRLGATVAVLDHIHFVCRNESNGVEALANAMQRIKQMAVKHRVKFIVVGQPRKASKQDKGRTLHVSDIKSSEAVVSDSDAVFALHRNSIRRPDPDKPEKHEYDPIVTVSLLKVRSKGRGNATAKLMFLGEFATFAETTAAEPISESSDVLI